jgi:DNA-binding response OmpR family regulator
MPEAETKRRRVLVVEDEDSIAIALDFIITREGYDHDRISSGAGALERIRETHPDLVLLDVMLPEVSGYEICQGVRLDPTLANIKILMMTAQGSVIGMKKGLALGADGFIAKPFELQALRNELRRLLQSPRAEAAGGPA